MRDPACATNSTFSVPDDDDDDDRSSCSSSGKEARQVGMRLQTTGISVGCNAVTGVVAWSDAGLLAFGANRAVALYDPNASFGVHETLLGHTGRVTVVRWLDGETLLSGAADTTVRIWRRPSRGAPWGCVQVVEHHTKSISSMAVCGDRFVAGSMDGRVNVYRVHSGVATLLQCLDHSPALPLALAFAKLPSTSSSVIAVGGTTTTISIYGSSAQPRRPDQADTEDKFEFKFKLAGHENWVRSFDFLIEEGTLLLASSSQDRYIRLWRFEPQKPVDTVEGVGDVMSTLVLLENKAHKLTAGLSRWKVSFEALLVSHEDWVFSVQFSRDERNIPVLLSSSADSSIILWYPDTESQIWTVQAQLGVISTKGASTATGSTGGFWGAIFSPKSLPDTMICAWNKTGSLRLWQKDMQADGAWKNIGGVGGHVKEVRSISWSPQGEYLLSTSLDQSTRLWAKHKDDTWKEFARPQIHGYDIQSVHVMSPTLFISGAEEKIVRVFQATTSVVDLLARVAGIDFRHESTAEAANVPALGLSNKALTATDQGTHLDRSDLEESIDKDDTPISKAMLDNLDRPPTEDHLQRHTLFPELEKLYGHGYEIQALGATHDGRFIVSGCRATTPDHAVLRLYDAHKYKELTKLDGHTLTATKARFSMDDRYLLSVSRDRSLCVYVQNEEGTSFGLLAKVAKAHKRIIWDCAWLDGETFATASRDGNISIWSVVGEQVVKKSTLDLGTAATAVNWAPITLHDRKVDGTLLAVGLEDGTVVICAATPDLATITQVVSQRYCDAAITGLAFHPVSHACETATVELALASEDCSLRFVEVKV